MSDLSGSGINPNISLGGNAPGGAAAANPLGMMNTLSEIQNRMNQNQLFQQQFVAKQRAGQILSGAPDMETGLSALYKDPQTAAFAGEIVNNARQGMLAQLQFQGELQKQGETGLTAGQKAISTALATGTDPVNALKPAMAALSPQARAKVEPALMDWMKAVGAGLPVGNDADTVAKRKDMIAKNAVAIGTAGGYEPDKIFGAMGRTAPAITEFTGPAGQVYKAQTGGYQPSGTSGAPIAVGPTTEETATLKGMGEAAVRMQDEMNARVEDLPQRINAVRSVAGALKNAQAGGLADLRTMAGSFAQGLQNMGIELPEGVTPDSIANHSLEDSQYFKGVIQTIVTKQLSGDVAGQGRSMRPEVDAYMRELSLATSPGAILKILNKMMFEMNVGFQKGQEFSEFRKKVDKKDPSLGSYTHLLDYPQYFLKQHPELAKTEPIKTGGILGIHKTDKEAIDAYKRGDATWDETSNILQKQFGYDMSKTPAPAPGGAP